MFLSGNRKAICNKYFLSVDFVVFGYLFVASRNNCKINKVINHEEYHRENSNLLHFPSTTFLSKQERKEKEHNVTTFKKSAPQEVNVFLV